MAINLPSNAQDIVNRQKADVQNSLPKSNPFLKNGLLTALVQSSGYRFFDMYQLIDVVQKGLFIDNAADSSVLDFWANLVNLSLGKPTASQGIVVFSGTSNGLTIPANTILSNGSLTYNTLSTGTIVQNSNSILQITQSGGTATITFSGNHNLSTGIEIVISGADQTEYNGTKIITVISDIQVTYAVDINTISPATGAITSLYYIANVNVQCTSNGVNTNLPSGSALALQTPITGINNNAFVNHNGLIGGSDTEQDDNYIARIKDAWMNPITGFNAQSIINEAKKVNGITRCFVLRATNGLNGLNYDKDQAGFVTVYCVKDNSDSIITNSTDNANIKTAIMSIAPMNDVATNINVLSLAPVTVDFSFTSIFPNTSTMQTAIKENIRQFFRSKNEINGVETGQENKGNINLNDLNLAILQTVDTITGQPLANYTLSEPIVDVDISDGQIGIEGNIVFI